MTPQNFVNLLNFQINNFRLFSITDRFQFLSVVVEQVERFFLEDMASLGIVEAGGEDGDYIACDEGDLVADKAVEVVH
jgi:ethanolamine utilization microcompartment shell protein EutL